MALCGCVCVRTRASQGLAERAAPTLEEGLRAHEQLPHPLPPESKVLVDAQDMLEELRAVEAVEAAVGPVERSLALHAGTADNPSVAFDEAAVEKLRNTIRCAHTR